MHFRTPCASLHFSGERINPGLRVRGAKHWNGRQLRTTWHTQHRQPRQQQQATASKQDCGNHHCTPPHPTPPQMTPRPTEQHLFSATCGVQHTMQNTMQNTNGRQASLRPCKSVHPQVQMHCFPPLKLRMARPSRPACASTLASSIVQYTPVVQRPHASLPRPSSGQRRHLHPLLLPLRPLASPSSGATASLITLALEWNKRSAVPWQQLGQPPAALTHPQPAASTAPDALTPCCSSLRTAAPHCAAGSDRVVVEHPARLLGGAAHGVGAVLAVAGRPPLQRQACGSGKQA